jgi:hypothetical protein
MSKTSRSSVEMHHAVGAFHGRIILQSILRLVFDTAALRKDF